MRGKLIAFFVWSVAIIWFCYQIGYMDGELAGMKMAEHIFYGDNREK